MDVGGAAARCPPETFTVDIHCVTKWSKLDTTWTGVSVDTLLEGVDTEAEYVTAWSRRRLHDQPAARGPHRRPGVGRPHLRRRAARARARRPGAAARAAPVLLEEREVGARPDAHRSTTSRASGRPPATTTTATRGGSSATGATDRPRAPLVWRTATVREVVAETPRARTLVLDVPGWPGHRAGQHVDVRLTAEDGYQAQRSYSIASAPELDALELTVERIDDGEVSPYLADELRAGDQFELRGPIGGHFTWTVDDGGPLLLVAGGSGLVPLMAMLRHRAAARPATSRRACSSRRAARRTCSTATSSSGSSRARGLSVAWTFTRDAARRAGPASRAASTPRCSPRSARARRRAPRLRLRPDAVRRDRRRPARRRSATTRAPSTPSASDRREDEMTDVHTDGNASPACSPRCSPPR